MCGRMGSGRVTSLRSWTYRFGPVARDVCVTEARACTRVRGDERLSGRQQGESDKIGKGKSSKARTGTTAPREKGVRKQRASELGRALRSIYDDTLRESVPDDFMDLLGKLR